jgi:hypothetical protein
LQLLHVASQLKQRGLPDQNEAPSVHTPQHRSTGLSFSENQLHTFSAFLIFISSAVALPWTWAGVVCWLVLKLAPEISRDQTICVCLLAAVPRARQRIISYSNRLCKQAYDMVDLAE